MLSTYYAISYFVSYLINRGLSLSPLPVLSVTSFAVTGTSHVSALPSLGSVAMFQSFGIPFRYT